MIIGLHKVLDIVKSICYKTLNEYFLYNSCTFEVIFMSDEVKFPYHLTEPHKISLLKNGNNPNIYYYFTYKHKRYRGSTGKNDLKSSIEEVFDIFYEVKTGKRKEGSRVSSKFGEVCKKYLKHKQQDMTKELSPRTLIEYKRNSKFLLEKFQN